MVTSPKLVIVEPVSAVKTMFTDSPLRLSDKKVMPDAIICFFNIEYKLLDGIKKHHHFNKYSRFN